jgi:predicted nicotinamide N-methyase
LWPSALILSRWLVTEPFVLEGKRVLEIGAGCGLTGLVAALLKQRFSNKNGSVVLTDFNATVLNNLQRNINLNELSLSCSAVGLDFYQKQSGDGWTDMDGNSHELVDVVLAADMICQAEDAVASAQTIYDVLVPGGMAYVVCADATHRFGVGEFASACKTVGLQIESKDVQSLYNGELVKSGLDLTSGYVEGMSLTMYFLRKAT